MVGADRLGDRPEPVAAEQFGEAALDAADKRRTREDQRGVELHKRGAGADLGVGIFRAGDTADPDQRNSSAGQPIDFAKQGGRGGKEWLAAETALLARRRTFQTRR